MAVKRLLNIKPAFFDSNGDPYTGARLFFYAAGSSTKQNTYTTSAGSVANSNPIELNSRGEPATEIWGTVGETYKIGLAIPGSDDPPSSFIWTEDNVAPVNDTTVSQDQWLSGPTPTYVSATSFTLTGDQTSTFHIGRRIKSTVSAGTVYSTISATAFGALTTVTVVNDSGTLDSGMSAVSYALLSATNNSIPHTLSGTYAIGEITLTTDLAVADGGTGASTAAGARTNLGAADDSAVVHLAGTENISGAKTFQTTVTVNSNIIASSVSSFTIRHATSDAADNERTIIAGGGDATSSRGAYISCHGNEFASDAGALLLSAGSGNIFFLNSGVGELARIDTAGNLLYNCTATFGSGHFQLAHNGASKNGINLHDTSTGATARVTMGFYRNTALVGSIQTTDTTTSFVETSDGRMKHLVVDAPYDADWINNVRVRQFEFIHAPGKKIVSFIAQELLDVEPRAVSPGDGDPNKVSGDEGFIAAGVDPSKLIPKLLKEVQILRARVDALESAQ